MEANQSDVYMRNNELDEEKVLLSQPRKFLWSGEDDSDFESDHTDSYQHVRRIDNQSKSVANVTHIPGTQHTIIRNNANGSHIPENLTHVSATQSTRNNENNSSGYPKDFNGGSYLEALIATGKRNSTDRNSSIITKSTVKLDLTNQNQGWSVVPT